MKTFKHKTILLTGASSGIGEAMAFQLNDPTSTLLLTARSTEKLNAMKHQLEKEGVHVETFPFDLSTPGAAGELHQQIEEAGFAPDVLINNAGFGIRGRFEDASAEELENMLTLNVTNLVSLTRHCLPHMLDSGDAGILNVASTGAYQPVPFFASYAASKTFVLFFSEALYDEYAGRGITVTCLSPGSTRTNFHDRADSPRKIFGPQESAEKVARVGLEALLNGKRARISGIQNMISSYLGYFAPRMVSTAVGKYLFSPEKPAH